MKIRALKKEDLPQILEWRAANPEKLRTPYLINAEQQEKWYNDVICNRNANVRIWAADSEPSAGNEFTAIFGLENIQWENRLAEVVLLINPAWNEEYKIDYFLMRIFHKAFKELNLENIYAECYLCSKEIETWKRLARKYNSSGTYLKARKYYNGTYYDSYYINFNREDFFKHWNVFN